MPIRYLVGSKAERQLQYEEVEEGKGDGQGAGGGEADGDGREWPAQFHIEVETTNSVDRRSSSSRSIFRARQSGAADLQKKKTSHSQLMFSPISSVSIQVSTSTVFVQIPPKDSLKRDPNRLMSAEVGSVGPATNPSQGHHRSSRCLSVDGLHTTTHDGRGYTSEDQTKKQQTTSLQPQSIQSSASSAAEAFEPRTANLTTSYDSGKGDESSGLSKSQDFHSERVITAQLPTRSSFRPHSKDCDHLDHCQGYYSLAPSTRSPKISHLSDPNGAWHQLQTDCLPQRSGKSCPKLQLTSTYDRHGNALSPMHRDQGRTKTSNSLACLPARGPTSETARHAQLRHLQLPSESYDDVTWSAELDPCTLSSDNQWKGNRSSMSKCPAIPQDLQTVQEKHLEIRLPSPNSASSTYARQTSSLTDTIPVRCKSSPDHRSDLPPLHFHSTHGSYKLNAHKELIDLSWSERCDPDISRSEWVNRFETMRSLNRENQPSADSTLLSDRSRDDSDLSASNYAGSTVKLISRIDEDNPAKDLLLSKLSANNRSKEVISASENLSNDNQSYSNTTHKSSSLHLNSNQRRFDTVDVCDTPSTSKDRIEYDRQFHSIEQTPLITSENNWTIETSKDPLRPLTANDCPSDRHLKWQKDVLPSTTSSLMFIDVSNQTQQSYQQQPHQLHVSTTPAAEAAAAGGIASQLGRKLIAVQNIVGQSSGAAKTLPLTSSVRDVSSTNRSRKTYRLKSSCAVADFVKVIPVRLPLPLEIPRILHNRLDPSEWQRAQKAFAKDQLGNVTKSRSMDSIPHETMKTCCLQRRTRTTLNECRPPLSPVGLCHKTQKPIDREINSTFSTDSVTFKEPKFRKDRMLKFPRVPYDVKCHGGNRMGAERRDYLLESRPRFSMSVNEDYCHLASQRHPHFTAVIYLERPDNYNQQLHLIKTELALSALIHFFHPCSSANVFWTADIRKQLSVILSDRSNKIQIKTKYHKVSSSSKTDQKSSNSTQNRSQPVRTGIGRDRSQPVRTGIGRNRSAALERRTRDVDGKCILLLSSDAGRLLRHKQTSLLHHVAVATDAEDVVVLIKVSE